MFRPESNGSVAPRSSVAQLRPSFTHGLSMVHLVRDAQGLLRQELNQYSNTVFAPVLIINPTHNVVVSRLAYTRSGQ